MAANTSIKAQADCLRLTIADVFAPFNNVFGKELYRRGAFIPGKVSSRETPP
jgi:hypothetical protein